MSDNVKTVTGTITVSYSLYCPYCNNYLDDYYDQYWWDKNIDIDMSDCPNGRFEVTCPKCSKDFGIDGFKQ